MCIVFMFDFMICDRYLHLSIIFIQYPFCVFVDKIKNGANIGLLLLTLMAVYSHYMVNDKLERTAPALVFLFMLSGRLVVYWQLSRKEMEQQATEHPHTNGFKTE